MSKAETYHELTATILYSTILAVCLYLDFKGLYTPKTLWIPKVCIGNEYNEYNTLDPQVLHVCDWWFRSKGLDELDEALLMS